jgi:pimeloyl-ACP methyl ester carboxylesterase
MTEFLDIDGGRIAYDVTGAGPLVVLSHGMGDHRAAYRFLAPLLVEAGYRVVTSDMRGCGESSTGWPSYSRTDVAGDLIALIRHLGGPAVIVGHSFSGGSATIAAATEPSLVSAIVEFDPFTRAQKISIGGLRIKRYRKGMTLLMLTAITGSIGLWTRYLDHAFPGAKPADYAETLAELQASLRDSGRMSAFKKMGFSQPTDAGAQLGNIQCDALVIMGTLDPDWADPRAEADGIVAEMPAGRGSVVMIDGAGHYAHTQFADAAAEVMLPFLKEHTGA